MTRDRRAPVTPAAQRELLTTFIDAARSGEMAALEQLFAADVTSLSDGNGRHQIARRPVVGAPWVAKFLTAMSWFWADVETRFTTMNGQTCAVMVAGGTVYGLLAIDASADGIDQLLWMLNPEKNTKVSVSA
jgi:RNA polymerase sigma-70 factor (ECF subfamily)